MNKRQKGVAIVEFALILPFLLLLTFITTEFGRAIWEYNTLDQVGARRRPVPVAPDPGTHIAQARNLIVYGNLAGTGSPLAMGSLLPTCQGRTPYLADRRHQSGDQHRHVRITGYTFNSMFTTVFGLPIGDITFPTSPPR